MKANKIFVFIFKLIITIIILALLFHAFKLDVKSIVNMLRNTNKFWFGLSLTGVFSVLILKAYRWKISLRNVGVEYSTKNAIIAYFAAYSIGIVSPGKIGELAKVYNVREDTGANFNNSFIPTLADRLFDLLFLIFFGLAASFKFLSNQLLSDFGFLFISLVVIAILVFISIIIIKILKAKFQFLSSRLISIIIDSYFLLWKKESLNLWLYTLISYAAFYTAVWFIFRSLNVSIDLINVGFVISLVSLILLLPISVAGFGTREAGLVYILSFYSVEADTAITFSILQFLSFYVWGGLIGLGFWLYKPVPFKLLRRDSELIFKRKRRNSH